MLIIKLSRELSLRENKFHKISVYQVCDICDNFR
jgi:hypothetical protein